MSGEFKCGDPVAIAGYLYGECDATTRAGFEAHLSICAACAAELEALGATRKALASWTPPEAALDFRITSSREAAPATVIRPARWWQRPLPAWAQAAAAVLIFAAGAGLGIQTARRAAAPAVRATASPAAAPEVTAADLAALERRLRAEMTTARSSEASAAAPRTSADGAAVVQRVRALLAESEQRQQRELALRLGQVLRDVDAQRRLDLARIERTFGQMEGATRPELAQQREAINYLIQRAGLQRTPQ